MSIGLIAREAYLKASMLEKALISKGILTEGESKQLYDDEIKKQNEERNKLREAFWNQLHDGDYIAFSPSSPYTTKYSLAGTLVAKSTVPFRAVSIKIEEPDNKEFKKGDIRSFIELGLTDILVRNSVSGGRSGFSGLPG